MKLLQRTHEPTPRYFWKGQRIDRHTFRNLLFLATQLHVQPTELRQENQLVTSVWDLTDADDELIKQAKSKLNIHEQAKAADKTANV
jgi:hypothetical protein